VTWQPQHNRRYVSINIGRMVAAGEASSISNQRRREYRAISEERVIMQRSIIVIAHVSGAGVARVNVTYARSCCAATRIRRHHVAKRAAAAKQRKGVAKRRVNSRHLWRYRKAKKKKIA